MERKEKNIVYLFPQLLKDNTAYCCPESQLLVNFYFSEWKLYSLSSWTLYHSLGGIWWHSGCLIKMSSCAASKSFLWDEMCLSPCKCQIEGLTDRAKSLDLYKISNCPSVPHSRHTGRSQNYRGSRNLCSVGKNASRCLSTTAILAYYGKKQWNQRFYIF